MRISTASIHTQNLQGLLARQQQIARTQQEMTSGSKLITAADDPSAMANAQRMDHAVAALEQYDKNSGMVEHRLHLQEQALSDTSDSLIRARELAIQANSGALSDNDRKSIALEIRSLRSNLLDIANRDDGAGRQLFAGTADGVKPFADSAGSVSYAGNDGRNAVDVGPGVSVSDADSGSAVFMRVRTGDGEIHGVAGPGNTGSGVLKSSAVTDYAAWNGQSLSVQFTASDAYEVVDAGGTVLASGSYTPGSAISAGGVQIELTGSPAAGDTFDVERSPNRDVFATLERLADFLDAPAATPAERAHRDNIIGSSIADLGSAQDHMLNIRASTGTRLSTLASTANSREAESISLASTLSGLRDVDYAEAATQLSLHLTALEAAQITTSRVQGLSLFDSLR